MRSDAGWSSLVARRAHNPKVAGSNPAPAIEADQELGPLKALENRPTETSRAAERRPSSLGAASRAGTKRVPNYVGVRTAARISCDRKSPSRRHQLAGLTATNDEAYRPWLRNGD